MTAIGSSTPVFNGNSTTFHEPLPLSKVLLEETTLHKAVEGSSFVMRLREQSATKEEYMQYLVNIFWGLEALEDALKKAQHDPVIQSFQFEKLYRLEALSQDIEHLKAKLCPPSDQVRQFDHPGYFRKLSRTNPHLLIAHAAVRYLAILFGGQFRAKRLETLWDGNAPTNLYTFSEDVHILRTDFLEKIDAFGKGLKPKQYEEFLHEIQTAWEFAGDIVGVNVRLLSRARTSRAAL